MKKIFLITLCFIFISQAAFAQALKLGLMPAADSILLYTAESDGIFKQNGLDIELIPFQSAVELLTAVRAGAIDLYFTDTLNVYVLHEKFKEQNIIATTSHANPKQRFFGVAVAPKSKAQSLEDLMGKDIANSSITITHYIYDILRENANIAKSDINWQEIKNIGARMQMLLSGQVEAAVLPEPLLSLVEKQGARVIIDDTSLDMPLAIIAMPKEKVSKEFVKAFQKSLSEAAEKINADPAKYRKLMLDKGLLPPPLLDSFDLKIDPNFVPYKLPNSKDVEDAVKWLINNKALEKSIEQNTVIYINE